MTRRAQIVDPAAAPPEADRVEGAPHPRETAALYGQQAAEAAFLDAWRAGRLPHAWLLAGPRGVGKATLAWRIARTMIARPPETGDGGLFGAPDAAPIPDSLQMDPDDPVFRRVAALGEGRIRLLRRSWDDKKKRLMTVINAEESRALKHLFQQTAADGGWRVAIVDCVDEMNPQAVNSLLKLIEEPPANSLFLLISHAPGGLLPTVRSRCRDLKLKPLNEADLLGAVAMDPGDPQARALALLAEGSAGEALRLAAIDGPQIYATLVKLLASAPGMDGAALQALASGASGREGAARLDAAIRLASLLLARLARAAARGIAPPEAAPGEAALCARFAAAPAQARIWADAAQAFADRAARARAVNLDPGQIILDTFLALDAAAARALAASPA